jgi:hypothetical protein
VDSGLMEINLNYAPLVYRNPTPKMRGHERVPLFRQSAVASARPWGFHRERRIRAGEQRPQGVSSTPA